MASVPPANDTFEISDEVYDKAKALYEAAVHEGGGSILKDYYTIFEYRERRAKFFDKLPGWSRRSGEIYAMVKRDSNYFFDEDDPGRQLDAMEIRELELKEEFPVLLPLPTTANTQTIDNFKTCPPIDGSRRADEVSEDEDEPMEDGDHEVDGAEDDYDEVVEDGRDVPTPGGSPTHSTPVTSPIVVEITNSVFNEKLSLLNDPSNISDLSDLATPMLLGGVPGSKPKVAPQQQPAPPPAAATVHTQKTTTSPRDFSLLSNPASVADLSDLATPMLSDSLARSRPRMAPPQPPVSTPVDVIQTQKTNASPKNFTVAPGVSSMSHYGMPGPVKSQQRQHTPEPAKMIAAKPTSASKASVIVPDTIASTEQTDTTEPAHKKQKVDYIVAKPAKALVVPTTSQPATNIKQAPGASGDATKTTTSKPTTRKQQLTSGSSVVSVPTNPLSATNNTQSTTVAPTSAPTSAAAPAVAPAVAPAAAQRRLNDIIAGRILPRSKQEAKDASNEQHNRLLAAYRAKNQNQSQSNTRKSARQSIMNINPDPDFMPHYFSAANFDPVDPADEDSSSVRCICGLTENDKMPMVQCKDCEVWQHTSCVFPTLDEVQVEEEEQKDFWCTVCDPYAHRHVLRALRTGQSVGCTQSGKGAAKAKGKAKGKSKK